jgi:hypothetical protein
MWCLICKDRHGLQVEVSPIVASAFVILQRYFRNSDSCAYKPFIPIVAELFAACKAADCFGPLRLIYEEIMRVCYTAPSVKIRSILGERAPKMFDPGDLGQITHAEFDLLRSIYFAFSIDAPFTHFEKWKQTLISKIPDQAYMRLCNGIAANIFVMICSAEYLDVPPEVSAAASAVRRMDEGLVPVYAVRWFNHVQEKDGKDLFELAPASISSEKKKTVQQRPG